jgi:hypothetical protein
MISYLASLQLSDDPDMPSRVCMSSWSFDPDDKVSLTSVCSTVWMTIPQARDLASLLIDCADRSESTK